MKKLKISQLAPDFRYLQKLALKYLQVLYCERFPVHFDASVRCFFWGGGAISFRLVFELVLSARFFFYKIS